MLINTIRHLLFIIPMCSMILLFACESQSSTEYNSVIDMEMNGDLLTSMDQGVLEQSDLSSTEILDQELEVPEGCTLLGSPQLDIPYIERGNAGDALTKLDIYPPDVTRCNLPIVLWVHGGAWSLGDKSNNLENKRRFFQERDIIFISVNYRLTRADNMVQHPDHVSDIAAAFSWVYENAATFGGNHNQIFLMGHSAGAHLVALLATNQRFLAEVGHSRDEILCVASYDTEYDIENIIGDGSQLEQVFTSDESIWEDASPIHHLSEGIPPFQLACRGTRGRVQRCNDFASAIQEVSGIVDTIDASSLDHEGVNDAIGSTDDNVMTPALNRFLTQCGINSL